MSLSKLTESQWEEVLERWSMGEPQESIAFDFNVCQATISRGIRLRGASAKVKGKIVCPNCWQKIAAHAKYCIHCGQEVKHET